MVRRHRLPLARTLDAAAPAQLEVDASRRYAVQLAAFRDRALALQFVARWQTEIPDAYTVEGDWLSAD